MTWKGINALDTHITVAIDGPSGAGKSTIARAAARRFGLIYVDTGAIYRTVGLAGERAGVNCSDADAMQALLPALRKLTEGYAALGAAAKKTLAGLIPELAALIEAAEDALR